MRVRKRTFSKLIGKTSSYRILTMHCFLKKKKSLEAVKIESKASVATIDKKKTTSVNPIEIQKMANWYKCTMERIRLFFFVYWRSNRLSQKKTQQQKAFSFMWKCVLLQRKAQCVITSIHNNTYTRTVILLLKRYRFWHARREKVTFEETDDSYSIGNKSESNEEWHLLLLQVSLVEMCVFMTILIGHP